MLEAAEACGGSSDFRCSAGFARRVVPGSDSLVRVWRRSPGKALTDEREVRAERLAPMEITAQREARARRGGGFRPVKEKGG